MNDADSAVAMDAPQHGPEHAVALEQLGIGTTLNIENVVQPHAPRVGARVIGVAHGQSIIAAPRGSVALPPSLHLGDEVHVRCLLSRSACGFRSRVLQMSRTPYTHFHLAYPDEVQTRDVRSAERAAVSIAGTVKGADQSQIEVEILDLSAEGVRLLGPSGLDSGETVQVCFDLRFGDVERRLELRGIVRNVTPGKGDQEPATPCRYGVQFEGIEEFERVLLRGFVFEQLVYHEADQREARSSG